MNIHPLFVHFPIALLTIYSIVELLNGFSFWKKQQWILPIKQFLLFVGVGSAFVTLQTGELAEHALNDKSLESLVETHAFFASASTYIFLALALIYFFRFMSTAVWFESRVPIFLKRIVTLYTKMFDHRVIILFGAVLGLLSIVITGALGGAIVYGPTVDPIVNIVYRLFFN